MGVLPDHHRQGIGRALIEAVAGWARGRGHRYLTVKTLAEGNGGPAYVATRAFYASAGVAPLEVLEDLWGRDLPCLLMIRDLS